MQVRSLDVVPPVSTDVPGSQSCHAVHPIAFRLTLYVPEAQMSQFRFAVALGLLPVWKLPTAQFVHVVHSFIFAFELYDEPAQFAHSRSDVAVSI
jgi:hypothetical protein